MTSDICRNCATSGVELRQIIPIVREGWGDWNREIETSAERCSTDTAISGIKVMPMPALTIWTNVDSELPSMTSRGRVDPILQNDKA